MAFKASGAAGVRNVISATDKPPSNKARPKGIASWVVCNSIAVRSPFFPIKSTISMSVSFQNNPN